MFDPGALAEEQVNRLGGVGRVLAVRLANPPADMPKLTIKWARQIPMLMGLWGRLAPALDVGAVSLAADDASDVEVRLGKKIKSRQYAEETATLVESLLGKAAVPLVDADKHIRNRVVFYFQKEIDTIRGIYKIDA